jgi:4-amino-4-deoxy-L-arabinose transferase-like glycosyltransferase
MTTSLIAAAQGTSAPPRRQQPSTRLSRWIAGSPADPRWTRPALVGLLAATAVLYLWGLGASGNANEFYAAAVQAGTRSWKAMFFGSIDAGNAITVDKPAFFLWPMEIAGRMFGFSSWSMLVPQALEGVAAVALLYAAVRRVSGAVAALAAGAVLALTPVAVLMFRFDNPDAMLTLLVVAALYCVVRALEAGATRWLVLAGVFIGLGFITKMGQALLVVPAMALAYLIAAPTSLRRRATGLLGAGVAMVAAAGWYIAVVDLWPASSRPYIGGSTDNSLLELALGYNGLGRLFGRTGNGGGGGGGGGGGNSAFGGSTGLTRLFSGDFATEISWLLPAALLALPLGLWLTRRAPRTDLTRAALVLFGGGLLATGLTFSYMQGTIHPYYTVALAPLVAGVLAVTGRLLWLARGSWTGRLGAAALLAVTVAWDVHLLALTPTFLPFLRPVLVVVGVVAAAALLAGPWLRRGLVVAVAVAVLTGAAGSTAYAIDTASQPHSGSIPSSGPVASAMGSPGRGSSGIMRGGPPSGFGTGDSPMGTTPPSGAPAGGGGRQGAGSSADSALTALLQRSTSRWAAATVGAHSAASLELASGSSVIAIGGFTGSDPAPTLEQFEAYVASGEIHYFIASGNGGGRGGGAGSSGSAIAGWVAAHYTATTVGGSTIYDLTEATTG